MKNLTIAIVFALFSTIVPLEMAQKAVAQDVAAGKVDTENNAQLSDESQGKESNTLRVRINKDSEGDATADESSDVVVELNGEELEEAEDQIREAVEKLTDLFGESFGAELTIELDELSDHDKRKLGRKIAKVMDDDGITISSDGHGMGAGEVVVALVAVSFTLGLPIIILLLVLIFRHKKRRQMLDLAQTYVNSDTPMPSHVMAEFGAGMSSDQRLRSGLSYTCIGIALALMLGILGDPKSAAIGLIPIGIGVSRLLFWKFENKQPAESNTNGLSLGE